MPLLAIVFSSFDHIPYTTLTAVKIGGKPYRHDFYGASERDLRFQLPE